MSQNRNKLIIQIPCLNEAEQLPQTLAALPREVAGFDHVEWLVVDDGSTDGTAAVARDHGVDHIIEHPKNMGLAAAFMTGVEECLLRGADVIVNTDADNQYDASCIPNLVAPILAGEAQMVVGARPILEHQSFSPLKKRLQLLGSWVVRKASQTDVPDAPSGFRAIDKRLAIRLFVFSRYTYTLETLIQAGRLNEPIASVPVRVNADTRPSRLFKSMFSYVWRASITIIRIFVLYKPLLFFGSLAAVFAAPGAAAFLRFLYFYMAGDGDGHIQSLVIGAALIATSAITLVGGLIADLVAANRMLIADVRSRLLEARLHEIEQPRN